VPHIDLDANDASSTHQFEDDESRFDNQEDPWYDVVSEDEDSSDECDGGIEDNDYEVYEEELNKLIRMEKD
jgi:hypothetical protein